MGIWLTAGQMLYRNFLIDLRRQEKCHKGGFNKNKSHVVLNHRFTSTFVIYP